MAAFFTITRCLFLGGVLWAAQEDANKEPVEIDFAPLPAGGSLEYALHYNFHSHGDRSKFGFLCVEKETPSEIRDDFKTSLEKAGWGVRVEGRTKLIVYGRKDDPIQKVEFKVDAYEAGVKNELAPTVKRLKKN